MAEEKKSRTWLWVVIGGGAFFMFVLAVFTLVYLAVKSESKGDFTAFGDKIGVVDLEGVILDSKAFIKQVKHYEEDDSVKAIIININSPGGGASASQEMYAELKRMREKNPKKPMISYIGTVGASGAYYAAAGTKEIIAGPASIVGSVGVIASWINYGDLLKWAKLKDETMKAGRLKDAGNPARDMTPEERAYLQGIIDNMHTQFIHDVAEGRGMKQEVLRPLATGEVWTGNQALPLHFIDKVGDFQDAVDEAAKLAGIKGEPVLVHPEKEKRTMLDLLFGDVSDLIPTQEKLMKTHAGFYYLWR
jgi:protease-4